MFAESINRRSKLPYYQQLYEILRGKIGRGEWKPGDMIPAEAELIDREPRDGAHGEVAFIHPRTLNGVLWELMANRRPDDE